MSSVTMIKNMQRISISIIFLLIFLNYKDCQCSALSIQQILEKSNFYISFSDYVHYQKRETNIEDQTDDTENLLSLAEEFTEDSEPDDYIPKHKAVNDVSNENLDDVENKAPIIGILAQELSKTLIKAYNGTDYTSYIAASYVKFMESAGARVVPIRINQTMEYYKKMFQSTNGLLIPGGSASLYHSGYAAAGSIMFDLAVEHNQQQMQMNESRKNLYPIWGTCLGFELLGVLTNDKKPNLKRCQSTDQAIPLILNEETWNASKIAQNMPADVHQILTTSNSTANFHVWCLTQENFTKFGMDEFWDILSTNIDEEGLEFISLFEAKNHPFWGSQFHPEKNAFEWPYKYENIPHDRDSVHAASYFADFFVSQARKNSNKFKDRQEEEKYSIYNFSPDFTGKEEIDFALVQSYMFSDN